MRKTKAAPKSKDSIRTLRGQSVAASRAATFLALCAVSRVAHPVTEHKFWDGRRFAFDFAWPDAKVALESEGGIFVAGRHSRGATFLRDAEKYNEAALQGWLVLRVASHTLCSTDTIDLVRRALAVRHA